MKKKACTGCGQKLPLSEFRLKRGVVNSRCRICLPAYEAGLRYRRKLETGSSRAVSHGESVEAYLRQRIRHLKSKNNRAANPLPFALTLGQLLKKHDAQGGLCDVTGKRMTHVVGEGRKRNNLAVLRKNPDLGYTSRNVRLVCYHVAAENLVK